MRATFDWDQFFGAQQGNGRRKPIECLAASRRAGELPDYVVEFVEPLKTRDTTGDLVPGADGRERTPVCPQDERGERYGPPLSQGGAPWCETSDGSCSPAATKRLEMWCLTTRWKWSVVPDQATKLGICRYLRPSDGLEPSTSSLPFRFRGGNRGHARVCEGTKSAQT